MKTIDSGFAKSATGQIFDLQEKLSLSFLLNFLIITILCLASYK